MDLYELEIKPGFWVNRYSLIASVNWILFIMRRVIGYLERIQGSMKNVNKL